MNSIPTVCWLSLKTFTAVVAVLALALMIPHSLLAQSSATGTILGRVQNKLTGDYLAKARIEIKGSNRSVLTDEGGFYLLVDVPAGVTTLNVQHSGMETQAVTVNVSPWSSVEQSFQLVSRIRDSLDEIVRLDPVSVQSRRETDAAAIAVNEQRVSRTQISVISADQFGTIPDTNPGEFLKWLPGVSVEYFGTNITGVSVRGLDAANTVINFDGMPVASAGSNSAERGLEVLGASAADVARVEVRNLRTPEDSANALGGSLNLVRRSAFEAARPRFTYNVTFGTHGEDFSLGKRPGIRDTLVQGWRPNAKLTWTHPVSKTLGYALTIARSDTLATVHWSAPTWDYGTAAQATAAEALVAAGRPLTTVSVYNPARTQDLLDDNIRQDITDSVSAKLDWRPFPELKLSYSLSASRYQERIGSDMRFTWNTGTPVTAGPDFTRGTIGSGAISYNLAEGWRSGNKPVLAQTLESEWRRGAWTLRGRGSYSVARHTYRNTEDGFFQATNFAGSTLPSTGLGVGTANPRRITVSLLDRDFNFSRNVEAYDAVTGTRLDLEDTSNTYIGGAVARPSNMREVVGALRLSAKRDFRFRNPFALQSGFDFNNTYRNRQKYDTHLWTFVGRDHIPGTADDSAKQIEYVNVPPSRNDHYKSPAVPRLSMSRLYALYVEHPDWFVHRDAESHQFSVRDPYELDENTYAGYLQITGNLLGNRLSYVGGVRYERSDAWGIGLLDRGSKSIPAGVPANSLQAVQARYIRKGAQAKGSNDGYFPSAEFAFNITEQLVLRAGYAKTQASNRFQRSVIPSNSLSFDAPTSGPFAGTAIGTINLRNPSLKPWTADNYEAHLEYYTAEGGVVRAGAFCKNIANNQVSRSLLLDTPALVAAFDLEPQFLNFQATSWLNEGDGRIDGAEFDARQSFDRLLPPFARGITLTGSFNYNNLSRFSYANGNVSIDFQNFYETQYKANMGYSRDRFRANVGFVRNGRVYRQRSDAAGREGHLCYSPYTTIDFSMEYSLNKWARLFLSGRNVTDAHKTRIRVVDGAPAWSQLNAENSLGVVYQLGLSGSF